MLSVQFLSWWPCHGAPLDLIVYLQPNLTANRQVLQEGLPFAGFSRTSESLPRLHSRPQSQQLKQMLSRGNPARAHPSKGKPWVLTSQGFVATLSGEGQQWRWAQVLLCQSDMEAGPPHLTWQTAQPDWAELSIEFSPKMKVSAQELSHRMGEDGRNRRII